MLKLNTTPAALMIFGHNKSKSARNLSTWIHCLKPHLSANPRLNFNMGFFIPLLQSLFQIISILFSGHPIIQLYTKVVLLNFLLKLLNLKSDSTLTLDYLYPALKNLAVNYSLRHERFFFFFFSFFLSLGWFWSSWHCDRVPICSMDWRNEWTWNQSSTSSLLLIKVHVASSKQRHPGSVAI